ncbi:BTAD domain-containing putative transcriptional regulator [Plantactinospora sp. WMMB782]|uniref:AfsR/SARP family transcriptional regulator n=1 Tax=Plantactinospora sp. WMMB782 TaxID=3404121 RepID=UPI003B9298A1
MAAPIDFGLLGPLEVHAGGRSIELGGERQRRILAGLLLHAGQTVSTARLTAVIWDEDPPATARRQIHGGVWQLRQALARYGAADLLGSERGGYRLRVHANRVDLARFKDALSEGRRLVALGDRTAASRVLRPAVSLWRGPALADLTGSVLEREAAVLEELRLDALEECLGCELAGGGGPAVIAELTDLAAKHPLRERLAAMLMTGLYQSGRQAEALEAYHRVATTLADELGLDPGTELRRTHEAILRHDQPLDPSTTVQAATLPAGAGAIAMPPAQLPPPGAFFVGRAGILAELDGVLSTASAGPPVSTILSIVGQAGVGKTAVAVHWAHRIRDRFPDGQLYVNLNGFEPDGTAALKPTDVLRDFLDALHIPPDRIPAGLNAQISLYRSVLADRRILVVLDNARDAAQVRPLVPGNPSCLVVVTSRNRLTGLVANDGAHPLSLGMLTEEDARELLVRRLGVERITDDPDAIDRIVRRCAGLPLALAIAAACAATDAQLSLGTIAASFASAEENLDVLAEEDPRSDLRTVFSGSYRALSPGRARLFRLLGLHPGPEIAASTCASLIGLPPDQVNPRLTDLVRIHLVERRSNDRYALHDLLRGYARQLLRSEETEQDLRAAQRRMLDHYLHTAYVSDRTIYPHRRDRIDLAAAQTGVTTEVPTDSAAALAWFTLERRALLGAVDVAVANGFDTHAWQLAWTLTTFLNRRGRWREWAAVAGTGLAAAKRLRDRRAEARCHGALANAHTRLGHYDLARHHHEHALDLYTEVGDRIGQAHVHSNMCWLAERQGHYRDALAHARHMLYLHRQAGPESGEASALNAIGWYHSLLGDHGRALDYCGRAVGLMQRLGDLHGEAYTWDSLAHINHQRGDHARAIACGRRAVDLCRDVGERFLQAGVQDRLGDTYEATGDPTAAQAEWHSALEIYNELDQQQAAVIRDKLNGTT